MGSELLPQSKLDSRLIRGAAKRMSPEELSEYVNGQLTPAQCVVRIKDYLKSIDFLTEVEQRKFYLLQAAEFLESMRSDVMDMGDSKARTTYLGTLKLLVDSSAKTIESLDDVVNTLSARHAQFFTDAIIAAVGAARAEYEARGFQVLEQDHADILQIAARAGIERINSVTEEEASE